MYDRTKYLKLTDFEACRIGVRAAEYVGIPKQHVDLFGAVFSIMIDNYLDKLKEAASSEEAKSGKEMNLIALINSVPLP